MTGCMAEVGRCVGWRRPASTFLYAPRPNQSESETKPKSQGRSSFSSISSQVCLSSSLHGNAGRSRVGDPPYHQVKLRWNSGKIHLLVYSSIYYLSSHQAIYLSIYPSFFNLVPPMKWLALTRITYQDNNWLKLDEPSSILQVNPSQTRSTLDNRVKLGKTK